MQATASYKKIIAYLSRLTDEIGFQKKVISIRKLCGIPPTGLGYYLYTKYKGKMLVYYPDSMDTPEIIDAVNNLTEKIGLYLEWGDLVQHYIVYNNFELETTWVEPIFIDDLKTILYGPFQYEEEKDSNLDYLLTASKTHPVAILIDPYTPERDIVDYVKKLFKVSIKPIQDKYRDPLVKLGKMRRKNVLVKSRNEFIYKNQHLPRKELIGQILKKFGMILDNTYIDRIIKDEGKLKKLSEHK